MSERTEEVKEARLMIHVTPELLADEAMLAAVKAEHEGRLAAMFAMTTTDPVWSEPEPVWHVEDDDEWRLVGRFFAGYLADGPPDLYMLTASQRGIPA